MSLADDKTCNNTFYNVFSFLSPLPYVIFLHFLFCVVNRLDKLEDYISEKNIVKKVRAFVRQKLSESFNCEFV